MFALGVFNDSFVLVGSFPPPSFPRVMGLFGVARYHPDKRPWSAGGYGEKALGLGLWAVGTSELEMANAPTKPSLFGCFQKYGNPPK